MVAISMYRGNLHKVPDVPRKWLMPTRQISVKDFQSLLRRRSRALSRLHPAVSDPIPIPNPNPDHNDSNADRNEKNNSEIHGEPEIIAQLVELEEEEEDAAAAKGGKEEEVEDAAVEEVGDGIGSDAPDLGKMAAEPVELVDVEEEVECNAAEEQQEDAVAAEKEKKPNDEEEEEPHNPTVQTTNEVDAESNIDKRKREVEEKLKVLKEKKHNLVQVLKQIQNAEEELKRRNSTQSIAVRPSVPLQVDIPNDTGSITRLNTPRMSSDGNLIGEMDGGEPDGMSNHNTDTRHLFRMSSTSPSPSSDSQPKKPAFNVVPHTARTNLGASSSPSRFAPTGQQGQTSSLPTVSQSGTNYLASSPSPAASGGTSVFKENRIPSPWN